MEESHVALLPSGEAGVRAMTVLGDPDVLVALAQRYERRAADVDAVTGEVAHASASATWCCLAAERHRAEVACTRRSAVQVAEQMRALARQLRALAEAVRQELVELAVIEADVRAHLALRPPAPAGQWAWAPYALPATGDPQWRVVARAIGCGS
jgi:hypothetical protein